MLDIWCKYTLGIFHAELVKQARRNVGNERTFASRGLDHASGFKRKVSSADGRVSDLQPIGNCLDGIEPISGAQYTCSDGVRNLIDELLAEFRWSCAADYCQTQPHSTRYVPAAPMN